MIANGALQALASRLQTTELNVRREYYQHLFLSYFYQQPLTDGIFFKGGTALRILFHSPRFSEDLDFSASVTDIQAIEGAIVDTLVLVARENIDLDLVESKTTTGGFLAIITFEAGRAPLSVQLEISLRGGEMTGEAVTVVSEFIPAYTLVSLAREQLVDEKIQALLSRGKARDFYDLYFMLRANLLPVHRRGILPQAQEALRACGIDFEKELKQYLPSSQWAIARGFAANLEREMTRFL